MNAVMSSSTSNRNDDDRRFLLQPSPPPSDQTARRIRTLLDLLTTEKIDGSDGTVVRGSDSSAAESTAEIAPAQRRWKNLRQRLGFNPIACCGAAATWRDDDEGNGIVLVEVQEEEVDDVQETVTRGEERESGRGMNLAAALAAEREYRSSSAPAPENDFPAGLPARSPARVSLMRLLVERETEEEREKEEREEEREEGNDRVCCVCMGRKKGAALIPCGHTYCRVCSREIWLNRGSCPLCNRPILDILHIF